MKDLEKLKEIFLADDIDSEDYQDNLNQITQWEKEIVENENLLEWQNHDITKEIVNKSKESLVSISLRLANDRELTDMQRAALFAKQDAMKWLVLLASDNAEGTLRDIKKNIKKALSSN